jgi:hypothetical protein
VIKAAKSNQLISNFTSNPKTLKRLTVLPNIKITPNY